MAGNSTRDSPELKLISGRSTTNDARLNWPSGAMPPYRPITAEGVTDTAYSIRVITLTLPPKLYSDFTRPKAKDGRSGCRVRA